MSTKKKAAKKKATKKAVKKAAGESGGGRPSKFDGKKIVKLVNENPRREGTHGHKTFKLYGGGRTYDAVIKAGGRRQDVAFDLSKKYIKLVA